MLKITNMVLILSINYITAVYRLRYPESYEIFASAQYKIVVRVKHWQTGCYSVTDNLKKIQIVREGGGHNIGLCTNELQLNPTKMSGLRLAVV
jgi:hypothetical protein